MVDVPGFLIGSRARSAVCRQGDQLDERADPGHGAKITIIMRRITSGFHQHGGGKNADEVAVWPMADLGFMDPAVSVNVLYGVKQQDDPESLPSSSPKSSATLPPGVWPSCMRRSM